MHRQENRCIVTKDTDDKFTMNLFCNVVCDHSRTTVLNWGRFCPCPRETGQRPQAFLMVMTGGWGVGEDVRYWYLASGGQGRY